jgi:SurA N-terminal domain
MFGTIRRHQSWLYPIFAVIIILPFLVYFNPSSRGGGGGGFLDMFKTRQSLYGAIDGQPITDQQYNAAEGDLAFMFAYQGRQRPDMTSPEMKNEIYKRVFLDVKADQLGIHPTADAAAELARKIMGPAGSYDDFVEKRLKPLGLTADNFDRFLRDEAARQQLQYLVTLNGRLVTPGEAEGLFRAEHRQVATRFVWFAASNYLQAVTVKPEAVADYYTNTLAAYSVPDKVQVSYVRFDASNYFAKVQAAMTNLDRDVEDLYARETTNLFPEAKTAEEAKAMARKELIRANALKSALRDAYELADELDQRGNHMGGLEKIAQEKGLTVRTTAPFDEETGPGDMGLTNDYATAFATAAFRLTEDAPFNHEMKTPDAAYVMELQKKFPSYLPPLKDIQDKVTADYRESRAYELAQQAATNFTTTVAGELNVNNGVTLPKTFADICAETGHKADNLPPFSLSSTNLPPVLEGRVDLKLLKQVGFSTTVGAVSEPVPVSGGCFVLFVEKMLPVDESQVKGGITEYLGLLRQARQNDALNLWFDSQIRGDPGAASIFQKLNKEMRESQAAQPPAR